MHLPSVKDETEKVREIIRKETQKPLDEIVKAELEHALEETILSSIERLPEIPPVYNIEKEYRHKTIPEVSDQDFTGTFFEWLKRKSTGEFGKVEEVHSDEAELLPLLHIEESGKAALHSHITAEPKIPTESAESIKTSDQSKNFPSEINRSTLSEKLSNG